MNAITVRKRALRDEMYRKEEERLERYLDKNFGKKVAEHTRQFALDLTAMLVWAVANYDESLGKKRLMRLAESIQPSLDELIRHYEMGPEDTTFLCLRLLNQNKGITEDDLRKVLLNVECEVGVSD